MTDPLPDRLRALGWVQCPPTAESLAWAKAANRAAGPVLSDPEMRRTWLQCEGTWFVGVDALPTDAGGAIDDVPLRTGVDALIHPLPRLHPAQLSVTFPGYPRPRAGESQAAFGFRLRRDAAHVDGILAEGPGRRRYVREPHAFILGLPLNTAGPDAAPLVVYEGSHHVMRAAFKAAFDGLDPALWPDTDITEAYVQARRQVFETCPRRRLCGPPGSAMLLHPLLVHGMAPWSAVEGPEAGRRVAYFRPELPGGIAAWLNHWS